MNIIKIESYPYQLKFKKPFKTANGIYKNRNGFIIKLYSDLLVGIGEVSPLKGCSNESLQECYYALEAINQAINNIGSIKQSDLFDIFDLHAISMPSLLFGLETAVFDILSQKSKLSLNKYLNNKSNKSLKLNGIHGLHDKDVYMHSLATLYFIENIINENLFPEISLNNSIFAHENTIIPYIKLAAFFHDIGKPDTRSFLKSRTRFISHEEYGSKISEKITPALPSDRAIRKLSRDCYEVINDLIYLDFADYLATSQNNFNNYLDHYNDLRKIYFRIMQFRSDKIKKYDKIIDGKEIMEIFGLNEGPEVGRVLDAIQDDIINNGNIKKSEAIKLAKKILNN